MAGHIRNHEQALAEADRRLRHAINLSFPTVRTGIVIGCGLTAAFTGGAAQGVAAVTGALAAASAVKSVVEDAWFWRPAVESWFRIRQGDKNTVAANDAVSQPSVTLDRK